MDANSFALKDIKTTCNKSHALGDDLASRHPVALSVAPCLGREAFLLADDRDNLTLDILTGFVPLPAVKEWQRVTAIGSAFATSGRSGLKAPRTRTEGGQRMIRMSTKTHGVLDLLTAGTLVALPRMLGWGERLTNTLTSVAIGTLGYSLLTNYEFGMVRLLPMRAHLALDTASGLALCASPAVFPEEDQSTHRALVGLGLFELGAALLTRPEPFVGGGRHAPRASARSAERPPAVTSSSMI